MEAVLDNDTATERISANMQRLLSEKSLTQSELARRIDASKMYVSHVIRGMYVPNVVSMARIAEALGVTVDDLISPPPKVSRRH